MKASRIAALEAEVSLLKKKLNDESANAEDAASRVRKMEQERANNLEEMTKIKTDLARTRQSLDSESKSAEEAKCQAAELLEHLSKLEEEKAGQTKRLTTLEGQLETTMGRLVATQEQEKQLRSDLEEERETFQQRVLSSEVVKSMEKKLQEAEDELEDKRKV